jgi:hypothetical protein
MANLLMAGLAWPWAAAAQAVASVGAVATIWIVFRRGPIDRATAALLAGTFLVTPYAFIYDMPVITAAVVLTVRARLRSGAGFSSAELALIAAVVVLPYIMEANLTALPLSAAVLGLFFAMIVRDTLRTSVSTAPLHPFPIIARPVLSRP